ncbi:MAG: M48 family metalloprotease, partial [Armatimonadetes bacterium]|nr:M48 family metalloprotease [Armatimonadota bacterium]
MLRLVLASFVTLGLMFGILFAVLTAVLFTQGVPLIFALVMVIGFAGLQYLISPFIIEWVHRIEWMPVEQIDPGVAATVREICAANRLREPRFGLIRDGNPNAFTFGHYPGNARVVVTSGLEVCDDRERRAVVAHEMGHILHWDFVVMTVAATIPLILYYIYRFGIRAGSRSRRNGGGALLVALGAFIAYIITQYMVLYLSRVREYYADAYSAQATGNANALATALVKIAYGLARARPAESKDEERETVPAAVGMKAFGIFDATYGKSMALAGAGMYGSLDQAASPAAATEAMKWDLWNPWAFFMELRSTHPLPAKRIRALGRIATVRGQVPTYQIPDRPPESYWDEFGVDLLMANLPLLGLLVGAAVGAAFFLQQMFLTGVGVVLAGLGIGMLLKMTFVYPRGRFTDRHV